MLLFDCEYYTGQYLSDFKAVQIGFKGILQVPDIRKLRQYLTHLSASIEIEMLILDYSRCRYAFIDYNSASRIQFWKNMEEQGLKIVVLIIPSAILKHSSMRSWAFFFNAHHFSIQTFAISKLNLLPYFLKKAKLKDQ